MQEWVWEARQNFCFEFMSTLLNILLRRSRYSSTTYSRLLSWINAEKNSLLVGGAPISLDYAEFWVPVSLGLSVLCFASIAFQYYSDIIPMYFGDISFFYLFLLFVFPT